MIRATAHGSTTFTNEMNSMTEEGGHDDDAADARYVDHTYHDFSLYLQQGGAIPKHKKSGSNFPARLHHMLADPSNSHIIAWMPHGRAWKIIDKELFMSTLVPAYFGQTKFGSFTRQLNGWGFKRLHQGGPDYGCYYHQYFLRGLPKLAELMRRVSSNQENKGAAKRPNISGEPNFSRISRQYPLPPPTLSRMEAPAVMKSPPFSMLHAPAHGSTQNQGTTLARADSTAAAMTASAPMHQLPANRVAADRNSAQNFALPSPAQVDHEAAAHVVDSSSAAAAMESLEPLPLMPAFSAPMGYQNCAYQMQNTFQSTGYHHGPPPSAVHSDLSSTSYHHQETTSTSTTTEESLQVTHENNPKGISDDDIGESYDEDFLSFLTRL